MNLRKEYELSLAIQEDLKTEAAIEWLSSNLIMLNEKMDRQGVSRLIQAVSRFDKKFGQYRDKLPSLVIPLTAAEEGLHQVVSGDTNYSRATDMFKHLMLIYNTLSDFFSSDLPLLLKTPVFRLPASQPDVRLDSITGPEYNPKQILKAFKKALHISPEERKLLGRIYRTIKMPSLDHDAVAKDLLTLSFNELVDLSSVKRVPMVVTPDAMQDEPQPVQGEVLEENFLEEAATYDDISKSLNMLGQIIKGTTLSQTPLLASFKNLQTAFQNLQSGGNVAKQILSGATTPEQKRELAKSLPTKEKVLLGQIDYTINSFKKLGALWPNIKSAFSDDALETEEIESLKSVITNQLKPNWKSYLGLAPRPYPGLGASDIANAIAGLASTTPATPEQPTTTGNPAQQQTNIMVEQDLTTQMSATTGTTGTSNTASAAAAAKANMAGIEQFFTKLNTIFQKAPGITSPQTSGTQAPEKTEVPTPTAPTTGSAPATSSVSSLPSTQGASAAPPPEDKSAAAPAPESGAPSKAVTAGDATIERIFKKTPEKSAAVNAGINFINQAGYEVILRKK